ncbi:MAG: GAF domain-containing protein [Thermodesulfobacteriota bacterium]
MNGAEILAKIIEISNASVDLDQRLSQLTNILARTFSFSTCALFLWDARRNHLSLKCCGPVAALFPAEATYPLSVRPLGDCARQKEPVYIPDAAQLSPGYHPLPPEFAKFQALIFYPIIDEIYFYGVLSLLGETPREISAEAKFLLSAICRQLAGTLRGSQIFRQARRRIAELNTLQAISQAITSTLELGELLNRITLTSTKILQADGAILYLLDEEGKVLKAVSAYGLEEGEQEMLKPVFIGEDVAGLAALTREPVLIPDVQLSSFSFKNFPRPVASALCVPLIHKGKVVGSLALFSAREGEKPIKIFDEEDIGLLTTMAAQMAIAIENAIILQRIELLAKDREKNLDELSLLYEVSRSLHATIKLDQILRTILISVTFANPLGFDRAALFLVNEKDGVLEGIAGIGARSAQETEEWRIKLRNFSYFTKGEDTSGETENLPFESMIRQVRIPLHQDKSILIKTLIEKRPFYIEDTQSDPEVNKNILKLFGSLAFASVPLIVKDRPIGLIAVDNFFTGRPITKSDLGVLTLLANQAAMAIENSRLYSNLQEMNTQLLQTQSRLIQSEKLAALGELVVSITHEIKNPLVSIGGFARRLERNFKENSSEKKYIRIILKEVKRLENILNSTLIYSREIPLPFQPCAVDRLLEETLSILESEISERNIYVHRQFSEDLPPILGDPSQLKQVFLNLLMNSLQAIDRDGQIALKACLSEEKKERVVEVEVRDTGGGIPTEILENIFNPFFTTKQEGTGLGLAIAHKIITRHKGKIEVINQPGVGVTFLVRFPLPE